MYTERLIMRQQLGRKYDHVIGLVTIQILRVPAGRVG